MGQSSFTKAGWAIEQYMVERLASALSCGDGYVYILFNPVLPDEVIKTAGSQAGIKRCILGIGFA